MEQPAQEAESNGGLPLAIKQSHLDEVVYLRIHILVIAIAFQTGLCSQDSLQIHVQVRSNMS